MMRFVLMSGLCQASSPGLEPTSSSVNGWVGPGEATWPSNFVDRHRQLGLSLKKFHECSQLLHSIIHPTSFKILPPSHNIFSVSHPFKELPEETSLRLECWTG